MCTCRHVYMHHSQKHTECEKKLPKKPGIYCSCFKLKKHHHMYMCVCVCTYTYALCIVKYKNINMKCVWLPWGWRN